MADGRADGSMGARTCVMMVGTVGTYGKVHTYLNA